MDEEILKVVEDESKGAPSVSGVGYARIGSDKAQYDLFFTNKRIIAATIFSQSDISDITSIAAFQTMTEWKKTREKLRQEYKGKTPQEILNLHKDSYEIPYDKIKSIRIKKKLIGAKLEIDVFWKQNLETIYVKIPKKSINEIEKIILNYLPTKVE